jgi:serine/threonine-protein kinase
LEEESAEVLDADFILSELDTVVTEKPSSSTAPYVVIADRYRLEARLGGGAMGEVWRAKDVATGQAVAIKIMRESVDPEIAARFHREARVLSRIRHPSVLAVFDYGTDPRPFVVMELLEGQDLEALLRREERLPLDRATLIFSKICEGLQNVHDAGIIHRDIKPANIFCMENGEVKLVDFGLAKRPHKFVAKPVDLTDGTTMEAPLTKRGNIMGTIKYISPEQLSRADIDYRSDLWSAAVVLFRMLTGQHAFPGMSDIDIMLNIMQGTPPVPSRDVKDFPDRLKAMLDNFFVRALQRNPAHRFGSASEMALALAMIAAQARVRQTTQPPRG